MFDWLSISSWDLCSLETLLKHFTNKLCDEWMYCRPVSAFDLFSSDETISGFRICDIFHVSSSVRNSRECNLSIYTSSSFHSSVFGQKPDGRWFRFPGLLLWKWLWDLLVFDVLSIFHFCSPLRINFTKKTAATLVPLWGSNTRHTWHVAQRGSCFLLIIQHGRQQLSWTPLFMCTEKIKKHGSTEEKSLFAVHLHSGNIFHVLHSPCCIFGLQS